MSDRFRDTRTYSKRSTDIPKKEASKAYTIISGIYGVYAKLVNVTNIDEKFKNIVNDFREFFGYSTHTRPSGLIKQQWCDYYKKHH